MEKIDDKELIRGLIAWQATLEGRLEALTVALRCLLAPDALDERTVARIESALAEWRQSSQGSPETPPETLAGFDATVQLLVSAMNPQQAQAH